MTQSQLCGPAGTTYPGRAPTRPVRPIRTCSARAQREARVLVTFDKDFGELAWRARLPADCGVVLFRIPMPAPDRAGEVLAGILASRQDWAGNFAVIEPGRVRIRQLPPSAQSG